MSLAPAEGASLCDFKNAVGFEHLQPSGRRGVGLADALARRPRRQEERGITRVPLQLSTEFY